LAIFTSVFTEAKLRFVFEIRRLQLEDDRLTFYIRPEDGLELPEIMKWMKQVFAQRLNAADGRTGHIWGDRYWSRILEGEPREAVESAAARDRPHGEGSTTGDRPHRWEKAGKPYFSLSFPRSIPISPG
jgi:hypothetical protein